MLASEMQAMTRAQLLTIYRDGEVSDRIAARDELARRSMLEPVRRPQGQPSRRVLVEDWRSRAWDR